MQNHVTRGEAKSQAISSLNQSTCALIKDSEERATFALKEPSSDDDCLVHSVTSLSERRMEPFTREISKNDFQILVAWLP